MRTLTVKKGSGTNYTIGWHTLTISNAKYGDYEGNKFLDIWFDGYSEHSLYNTFQHDLSNILHHFHGIPQ